MRSLFLALACGLALTACDRPGVEPLDAPAFPEQGEEKVDLSINDGLPEWVQVARQSDGGSIFFDRTSIVRYPGEEASIWIEVRYEQQQPYEVPNTDPREVVFYRIERVQYRFQCAQEAFAILERRIIGPEESIVSSVTYDPVVYRPATVGGVAPVVLPVACRGR